MKIKKINRFLKIFLPKNIAAITLAPFGIYCKEEYLTNERLLNHEKIHWEQQKELLIIPFYIIYLAEFLVKSITTDNGYMNISFEKEAYANGDNLKYLETRKRFSWYARNK